MDELDVKLFEREGSPISTFFDSIFSKIAEDASRDIRNDTF